jgi:RNA polymerase sigma-70 factor (ECF subfamily)
MSKIADIKSRKSVQDRFETLMRPHFDALYGAAHRLLGSASDAEDLVQEACVKAYLKMDELERMEYQRAWLMRVLYNLFIDTQRRVKRSPVDIAAHSAQADEVDLVAAGSHMQPDEQVDSMMRIERILDAMKLLGRDKASLLALHDIEGVSLSELQALTGLPSGTLKSQLHRTRVKLGRLLQREEPWKPSLSLVRARS